VWHILCSGVLRYALQLGVLRADFVLTSTRFGLSVGMSRKGISLLVRNISYKTREDDLKDAFGKFGEVRDVYMPRDYHTKYGFNLLLKADNALHVTVAVFHLIVLFGVDREMRGFAFVEFIDARDARDAQEEMDRAVLDGRELQVVFAQVCKHRFFVVACSLVSNFRLFPALCFAGTPQDSR
jgi:RNA recognition motif-containing protein